MSNAKSLGLQGSFCKDNMKGAIIYISSNREKPEFEGKIFEDMYRKSGNLPIYIVSQKPMEAIFDVAGILFTGRGRVIGNVGTSGFNFCRQLQMAVEIADVDYVISCEADCLYSPDYFTFKPPRLDAVYRNTNIYVLRYQADYFSRKRSQTAFQVAGRDFLLDRLNYLLKDQPQWNTEMKNFPKEINQLFLESWEEFATEYACFGIKTGEGMRKHTSAGSTKVYEIPYWGSAKDIRKKFNI